MLQCPKEAFVRLFYNLSASFLLLFIFFHFTLIFLAKLFTFFGGSPFYHRNQDGYVFDGFSDEEMEDGNDYYGPEPFMPDVIRDDEEKGRAVVQDLFGRPPIGEEFSPENLSAEETSRYSTPAVESSEEDDEVVEEILAGDSTDSEPYDDGPTPTSATNVRTTSSSGPTNLAAHEVPLDKQPHETDISFRQEESFMVFQPPVSRGKELLIPQDKEEENEIFEDTFTLGSTSRDSSEWRSSMNEDPFSSSSRRSCPKWESYTFFQKYDEEMLFLDRITVQKLQETETLRSIKACPRSISERIALKLKRKMGQKWAGPYRELELAYVAQICSTWEALGWSYSYFQRLRASRREFDPGCPAYVAQQFQQFQVLLQRYIETEPYENGPRPEIYARMRSLTPKLLQVPEYRDSDDARREENQISSRIPSTQFLRMLGDSIRTFLNFLKQDKRSKGQILADLLGRSNPRGSAADSNYLFLLKKINKEKKGKVKEVLRTGKCFGRRRKLTEEKELEVVMAVIDLKMVSRVLRMAGLSSEQLRWCESKMSRIRVSDGKLHRDCSPLFFPAH